MDDFYIDINKQAYRDIAEISDYIKNVLKNHMSATNFVDIAINTIYEVLTVLPYGCKKFVPKTSLKHDYRMLIIDHKYIAFYTIDEIEKIIDIRRVLAGRTNYEKELD